MNTEHLTELLKKEGYDMESHIECPFCYSANVRGMYAGTLHCESCDCIFDINDIILEPIRHRLSAFLCGNEATEKNPFLCEIEIGEMTIDHGHGRYETIETPVVTGIYETYDGIILFNIDAFDEPMEFDGMCLEDLVAISDTLCLDAIEIIK